MTFHFLSLLEADPDLLGYWPLTNKYGNQDLSLNNKPVTFNGMTYAGSDDHDAVVFSSTSTYVSIPNDGTYDVSTFTWAAYFKPYSSSSGPLWMWYDPIHVYSTHMFFHHLNVNGLYLK